MPQDPADVYFNTTENKTSASPDPADVYFSGAKTEQVSPLKGYADVVRYLGASYKLSDKQTSQALKVGMSQDMETAYQASLADEQADGQFKANEIDPIEKEHGFDLIRILGEGAKAVPMIREVVKNSAIGGGVGAAGGAAVGLAGGPFAEVTVPGGAVAGLALGARGAAFVTAANIGKGSAYISFRKAGLDPQAADKASTAVGATTGIINSLQLNILGKQAQQSALAFLESSAGKELVQKGIQQYVNAAGSLAGKVAVFQTKHAVSQGALGGIQSLTTDVIQNVAAFVSGKPGAALTPDQIATHLAEAIKDSAQMGMAAGTAASLGGKALSPLARMLPHKEPQTLEQHSANVSKLASAFNPNESEQQPDMLQGKAQINVRETTPGETAIQELQTQLDDLVSNREKTEKKLAKAKEKVALLKEVKDNKEKISAARTKQTVLEAELESWQEAEEEIKNNLAEVTTAEKKKAQSKLDKVLEQTKPKKIGKHLEAKVEHAEESNRQTVLDMYRMKAEGKNLLAEEMEAEDRHLAQEITTRVGDLKNASPTEIYDLAHDIKTILKEGLDKRTSELVAAKEIRVASKEKVLQAVIRKDPKGKELVKLGAAADADNVHNAVLDTKRFLKAFGNSVFSFPGKLKIVFQNVTNGDELAHWLDPTPVIKKARANVLKQQEVLKERFAEATGLNEQKIVELLVKGAGEKLVDGDKHVPVFQNAKGGLEEWHGTINQAVGLLMNMDRKILQKGLIEGNGYTLEGPLSTREVLGTLVASKANGNYIKLAEGLKEFYAKDNGPRLAKYYRADTGLDLHLEENYAGQAARIGYKLEESFNDFLSQLGLESKFIPTKVKPKPGFTIATKDSSLGLQVRDPFTQVLGQIEATEQYGAWHEPAKLYSAIFNDAKIKQAIKINFGAKMLDALELHLDDIINREPQRNLTFQDTVSKILGKIGAAALPANPLRYIKHVTSTINFLQAEVLPGKYLPTNAYLEGLEYFYNHRAEMNKIIESSPEFKARYAKEFVGQSLRGDISKAKLSDLKNRQFLEFISSPLWMGDMESVRGGFTAVYRYVLKETGSKEEAMNAAENAFNRVQYSNSIEQLSNVGRQQGLTKALTQFTELPTRMFETEVTAWRKAINYPSAEHLYAAARVSLISHMSQIVFYGVDAAFIAALPIYSQQQKDEAAWHMLMAGFVGPTPLKAEAIVTPFATIAWNASLKLLTGEEHPEGTHRIYEPSIGIYDQIIHGIHLFDRVSNEVVKGEVTTGEVFSNLVDIAHIIGAPDSPFKLLKAILAPNEENK